jgi:flavin-dependent thymidylate synthase
MPSKDITKWADQAMWSAEPSERDKGTRSVLVSCNSDPLGEIAALNKTYIGQTVTDLSTITDDERRKVLADIKATVLKMPLEVVQMHFHISGVHRGITHQMVRQRTGAYAQESMRFAVKEDLAEAIAYPPSLRDTVPWDQWYEQVHVQALDQGIHPDGGQLADMATNSASQAQRHRRTWDEAVAAVSAAYSELIEDGMPAEEARGLVPTNVLTKLHYITNLRSFYDTMAMRVSDQAQYEWRELITAMVRAMRDYGETQTYRHTLTGDDIGQGGYDFDAEAGDVVSASSAWQFRELTEAILPVDFALGRRGFGSPFDRASRTGERVDAFAAMGVPAERWLQGAPEYSIPALRPEEWLLDPDSARLKSDQEFDIFGNRVTKGTGWHWSPQHGGHLFCDGDGGLRQFALMDGDGPTFNINDIIAKKGK